MSTVPKLTYAKIGKGPKGKVESISSQLLRNSEQKSDDLFSHMNQDNLKYIKKELKLKKNRSDQERPNSPLPDRTDPHPPLEDQITHRDKLYHKYRGDEQVSEREPHLQQTQRRSDSEKALPIILPLDIQEDYDPTNNTTSRPPHREAKVLSTSANGVEVGFVRNGEKKEAQGQKRETQSKMYQSLPQDQAKKRLASIEGFFGEAMSTNLNRHEGAQFIQFLQEYISDLNHSKHLNSKQNEDISVEKKQDGRNSRPKQQQSREKEQKNNVDKDMKESLRKLDRIKRNSDTFGQPNSKFTLNSEEEMSHTDSRQLEQLLKEQKLNSMCLAKQIERLRKLIGVKEDIIKSLEINNELMKEEIMHVKIQHDILNKSKKFNQSYSNTNFHPQKSVRIPNDELSSKGHTDYGESSYHQRHASTIPQRPAMSYRSTFKATDQFPELFQEFAPAPVPAQKYDRSREKGRKKQSESLEKLKKEYDQFMIDSTRHLKYQRGGRRTHQEVF